MPRFLCILQFVVCLLSYTHHVYIKKREWTQACVFFRETSDLSD